MTKKPAANHMLQEYQLYLYKIDSLHHCVSSLNKTRDYTQRAANDNCDATCNIYPRYLERFSVINMPELSVDDVSRVLSSPP